MTGRTDVRPYGDTSDKKHTLFLSPEKSQRQDVKKLNVNSEGLICD
ncbi:hypothetical protein LC608_16555 [Nostoc sp. XA010]|nr:hypothetical protein [Nostoc sp. XA010]MCC5658572.1 hypothetical protein [Nostoc sp. XA010]